MRAEDRQPWDQWWIGVGERELQKTLARWGFSAAYAEPVRDALRGGADAVVLERLLAQLRVQLGDPPDEDANGWRAVSAAIWWDGSRYSRKHFGAL